MCLSIPGKVVEISNDNYVIDYSNEKVNVNYSTIKVKVGDYVIVSNKIIIAKVPEDNAKKFFQLIGGLNVRKDD